jgi:simple sugar transport system ATP-binding protein
MVEAINSRVPAVRLVGITKRFPGVLANDDINLEIQAGEIHALLGENGAGKSTLMNILSGLYAQDQGQIYIRGELVALQSPRDAIELGIGMVHQHFMLVEMMTVAENVTLGLKEPGLLLKTEEIRRRINELSRRYGLQVDPDARIWQLSVGEQQRVEIIKMLYRGAEILILDEPTAVLTPGEVEELFAILETMMAEGHSVVFISHKLDEVLRIADRVTVLRKGRVVATVDAAETTKVELARLMVGREVLMHAEKTLLEPGSALLKAIDLHANNDKGMPALKGVSFEVHENEILGIAGVAGNGQRELAEVITGLRPLTDGQVVICDRDTTQCSPREIIDQGVSHIPEDRLGTGSVPNLAISDNVMLKDYRRPPIARGPFLQQPSIDRFADRLIALYDIAAPHRGTAAKLLSGGNLQKTILARELSAEPQVLVAVHPTRGLDVGATESIQRMLLEQREEGAAILLLSEDLDELLALSDRIAVLYEGKIMGIIDAKEADMDEIGLMMAGSRHDMDKGREGETT